MIYIVRIYYAFSRSDMLLNGIRECLFTANRVLPSCSRLDIIAYDTTIHPGREVLVLKIRHDPFQHIITIDGMMLCGFEFEIVNARVNEIYEVTDWHMGIIEYLN